MEKLSKTVRSNLSMQIPMVKREARQKIPRVSNPLRTHRRSTKKAVNLKSECGKRGMAGTCLAGLCVSKKKNFAACAASLNRCCCWSFEGCVWKLHVLTCFVLSFLVWPSHVVTWLASFLQSWLGHAVTVKIRWTRGVLTTSRQEHAARSTQCHPSTCKVFKSIQKYSNVEYVLITNSNSINRKTMHPSSSCSCRLKLLCVSGLAGVPPVRWPSLRPWQRSTTTLW